LWELGEISRWQQFAAGETHKQVDQFRADRQL
jgi:hypothetical protein